ncbi:hypothetical protein GJAV_G00130680 [Gymnothorax javanicus]|nr:hypothetical protein GJAV_G00130680 [Gymnothorax javanicus]
MEPSRGTEPASKTKPLSDGCNEVATGSTAVQPEADPSSESPASTPPETQPPGRLRKTAFRLFRGRKSICSLPSFFGGKNRSQAKTSSKNGISKSKTHDCITKLSWEDGRGAGSLPAGNLEYHGQKGSVCKSLTSSAIGHSANEPGTAYFPKGELSLPLPSETGDHIDKSTLSFPRPKKGLKGLFSSIRRHRRSKNVESGRRETFEMSVEFSKDSVPVSGPNIEQHDCKHLDSMEEPVVSAVKVKDGFIIARECMKDKASSENDIALIKGDLDFNGGQVLRDAVSDVEELTGFLKINGEALCSNSKLMYLPSLNLHCIENEQLSPHSSDQISFIFGEVASLKSFDSLTGCGDIIADQDDDSVAESSISGERSRTAGKRSSCYVTYQGGGEEMATPNEVEGDYLQALWEDVVKADICYSSSQLSDFIEPGDSLATGEVFAKMEPTISSNFPHGVVDGSFTPGDVLTPQSDHQESVPNSDEGYYDSTTPGLEEEGDRRLGNERVLRDSYSGDALYELFEADDSLMSTSLERDSSLETQPLTPDPLEFLNKTLQSGDAKLHSAFSHKTGLMETEEARLIKIQQDLLCCELQSIQKAPNSVMFGKGRFKAENNLTEVLPQFKKLHELSLKDGQVISQLENQKGKNGIQESLGLEGSPTEAILCNSLEHEMCQSPQFQEILPCVEQGKQRTIHTENLGNKLCSSKEEAAEKDQTVCFSQALVDFTKHAKLFGDLSDGLQCSDSSSSFAQNIDALPAMVTFDIVDMEDDGECDHQMDMVTDEDVVSPHEAFDESYLQKDAFADCDKMFEFYDQAIFLGNTWGVASLPRHLSLTRVNQPMPVPLSLNRRSRSLDTDGLEFELGRSHFRQSKVAPSSALTPSMESDSKLAASLHRKQTGLSASSELKDGSNLTTVSWQQEPARSFVHPPPDWKRAYQVQDLGLSQKERTKLPCDLAGPLEVELGKHTSGHKNRTLILKPEVEDRGACNFDPQSPRHLTRPSHLPLRSGDTNSQPQSDLTGDSRETLCDRSNCVSKESCELYFAKNYASKQYADPSSQHAKMKPIGVTLGMPHFHSDVSGASKVAFCHEHQEFVKKGRNAVDEALPPECNKHTT